MCQSNFSSQLAQGRSAACETTCSSQRTFSYNACNLSEPGHSERMADRLNHLEDKEKAAKKLKRLASAGHKKAQKVQKARKQSRTQQVFTVFASLAGTAESLQGPEPQAAANQEVPTETREGHQTGKGRSQIDSKSIAHFLFIDVRVSSIEITSIETVSFRK